MKKLNPVKSEFTLRILQCILILNNRKVYSLIIPNHYFYHISFMYFWELWLSSYLVVAANCHGVSQQKGGLPVFLPFSSFPLLLCHFALLYCLLLSLSAPTPKVFITRQYRGGRLCLVKSDEVNFIDTGVSCKKQKLSNCEY